MEVSCIARLTTRAVGLLLMVLAVCAPCAFAVEPAVPSSVDVYWKSTRTIAAPGISSVVILDDDIAHAQIGNESIEFVGLCRGETIALAYLNGTPISIVIHVIEHPFKAISPSLLRRESELAHGSFGSDFQFANSGGASSYLLVNSLSWSQQIADHRLDVISQVEDNTQFGGHKVNLRTGGAAYRTPHVTVNVVDFNQSLTGSTADDRVNNFSSSSLLQLRGAGVTLNHGQNEYSIFAGATIPYYFLSLNGTRDVAGVTFHRKQAERLSFYGNASYVNLPVSLAAGTQRRDYWLQTAGATYRLGKSFLIGGQGGTSNAGHMMRGDASYSSFRFSAYGSAIFGSQTFPLNQLQSLFSGTSSLKGGISYRATSKLTQAFYFDHTTISPGLIYKVRGNNDYFSPTFAYSISRGETLNLTYVHSRNEGGFAPGTTVGNRYDVSLSSQLPKQISNAAQITVGSVQDPLQISSEDEFSIRDSISIPIRNQILLLGVEHNRSNPSLIAKLNQEINLLSPALQMQFLADPKGFIDSSNFPPEVKALLAASQPIGTSVSASSSLSIGSKLRLTPNFSLTHAANGSRITNWTQVFGYSLTYQVTSTLQFRSSLTNALLWDSSQNGARRTTILSGGFLKSFNAAPGALPLLRRSRSIQGRVFRDNNINGAFNDGEPGIEGIEVRLDEGQVTVTDSQGRYRFHGVSADHHLVSIDLTQFRDPIRMTTRGENEVDLIQQHTGSANFGILDFARVMGTVYNDLRLENRRQPDSKGMQGIGLLLDNGKNTRQIETTGSGDFELDNVPPGDYKLSLDPASIPANYVYPRDVISIHVSPVSTVLQDLPLRALRSISGRVLLKVPNEQSAASKSNSGRPGRNKASSEDASADQDSTFVPVTGVEITAGPAVATTDQEGRFLLRNLPAGDLKIGVHPVRAVPSDITVPSGEIKLPAEPIQIQDATIVITSAELLPYLTQELPTAPGGYAQRMVASAYRHARERDQQQAKTLAVTASIPNALEPNPQATVEHQPTEITASHSPAPPAQVAAAQPTKNVPAAMNSAAVPGTVARVTPAVTAPSNAPAVLQASSNAALTRNICQSLPSLGEIAQCLRQLRTNAASASLQ